METSGILEKAGFFEGSWLTIGFKTSVSDLAFLANKPK